jgi:hypothetical protein
MAITRANKTKSRPTDPGVVVVVCVSVTRHMFKCLLHSFDPAGGWMDACVMMHGVRQPSPKGGEAPPPPTPNLPTPIRSFPGFVRSYITRKEEAEEERKNESE